MEINYRKDKKEIAKHVHYALFASIGHLQYVAENEFNTHTKEEKMLAKRVLETIEQELEPVLEKEKSDLQQQIG